MIGLFFGWQVVLGGIMVIMTAMAVVCGAYCLGIGLKAIRNRNWWTAADFLGGGAAILAAVFWFWYLLLGN